MSSMMRKKKKKKRATTQTSLDHFLERGDRTESSKEVEPLPSMSSVVGVSEIAACPLPPVSDGPSALSTPTSSPSLQSATLLAYSLDSSAGMSAVALYHWAFQRTVYC